MILIKQLIRGEALPQTQAIWFPSSKIIHTKLPCPSLPKDMGLYGLCLHLFTEQTFTNIHSVPGQGWPVTGDQMSVTWQVPHCGGQGIRGQKTWQTTNGMGALSGSRGDLWRWDMSKQKGSVSGEGFRKGTPERGSNQCQGPHRKELGIFKRQREGRVG